MADADVPKAARAGCDAREAFKQMYEGVLAVGNRHGEDGFAIIEEKLSEILAWGARKDSEQSNGQTKSSVPMTQGKYQGPNRVYNTHSMP